MLKRWETASSLDRTVMCPAAAVLPKFEDELTDSQRRARDWGTSVHKWVETGKFEGPGWAQVGLKRKLEESGVSREDYWPQPSKVELRVVWDLESMPKVVEGPWPEIPGSVRMVIDYLAPYLVDDIKTGRQAPEPTSFQVGVEVAAVAQMTGASKIKGAITHWPRYPLEGKPERRTSLYTKGDFVGVRDVLRSVRDESWELHRKIEQGQQLTADDVRPGEHCNYCRCQKGCPAWQF